MRKASNKQEVNVYIQFLNYCGEVNEEHLVATFHNMNWARLMLEKYNERENDKYTDYSYTKLKVEEVK